MPVHTMKEGPCTLTHEMQTDAQCTADYVLFSKLANWRYATHTSLLKKESMILPTTKNYGWGKVECGVSSQTALVRWLLCWIGRTSALYTHTQRNTHTHTETHILPHTNARTHARTHTHTLGSFKFPCPPFLLRNLCNFFWFVKYWSWLLHTVHCFCFPTSPNSWHEMTVLKTLFWFQWWIS